jgi:hypothetical protein
MIGYFIFWGVLCTLYSFGAEFLYIGVWKQFVQVPSASGTGDLMGTFLINSIAVLTLTGFLMVAGILGKGRYPEWSRKQWLILLVVVLISIPTGFGLYQLVSGIISP